MPVPYPSQLAWIQFERLFDEGTVKGVRIRKHEDTHALPVGPAQHPHGEQQSRVIERQFPLFDRTVRNELRSAQAGRQRKHGKQQERMKKTGHAQFYP